MKFTYTRPVVNGFIAALSSRVQAMFAASSAGSAQSDVMWMLNGAPRCPIAMVPSGTRAHAPPPGKVRIWVSGEGMDRW